MEAAGAPGGLPKVITVKLGEDWRARRNDDGRWYFYAVADKVPKWEPPAGFDVTNKELDATWEGEHAGLSLPPATSAVAASDDASRLEMRALAARFANLGRLVPARFASEEALAGTGTFTQVGGTAAAGAAIGVSVAGHTAVGADLLHSALSAAVVASAPPGELSAATPAGEEWARTLGGLLFGGPDAALRQVTRAHLASMPVEIQASPPARAALAQVAGSTLRGHAAQALALVSVLDKYAPPSSAAGAAAAAVPPSSVPPPGPLSLGHAGFDADARSALLAAAAGEALAQAAGAGSGAGNGSSSDAASDAGEVVLGGGGGVKFHASASSASLAGSVMAGAAAAPLAAAAGTNPPSTPTVDAASSSSSASAHLLPATRVPRGRNTLSPDELAVASMIETFAGAYSRDKGRELLASSSGRELLGPVADALLSHPRWRAAVIALADALWPDELLTLLVQDLAAAAGGAHARSVIATRPLAAAYSTFQGVLVDALTAHSAGATAGSAASLAAGAARSAAAAAGEAALLLTHEHGALLSIAAAGTLASRGAGNSNEAAAVEEGEGTVPLACAARAGRLRQELGYSVLLARGGGSAFVKNLGVAPVGPHAVLAVSTGDATGSTHTMLPGVLDAALTLRSLALAFFGPGGGAGDIFLDEALPWLAGAAEHSVARALGPKAADPLPPPPTPGAHGLYANGQTEEQINAARAAQENIRAQAVRDRALAVAPLSAADTAVLIRVVTALNGYFVAPAVMQGLLEGRAADEAMVQALQAILAAQAAGDAEAAEHDPAEVAAKLANARELLAAQESVLAALDLVGRVLRQPDVVALLLHALFHPGVTLDEPVLPSETEGAAKSSSLSGGLRRVRNDDDDDDDNDEGGQGGGEQDGDHDPIPNTRVLAKALAWGVSRTGVVWRPGSGEDGSPPGYVATTAASDVASCNVTDACVPREAWLAQLSLSSDVPSDPAASVQAEAAWFESLLQVLTNTSPKLKAGNLASPLAFPLNLALSVDAAAAAARRAGAFGVRAAAGVASAAAVTPAEMAVELADLAVQASTFPLAALGFVHWLRHTHLRLVLSHADDNRYAEATLTACRLAVLLATGTPTVVPHAIALIRAALLHPPQTPLGSVRALASGAGAALGMWDPASIDTRYRSPLFSMLVDLAVDGAALEVLDYVTLGAGGDLEAAAAIDAAFDAARKASLSPVDFLLPAAAAPGAPAPAGMEPPLLRGPLTEWRDISHVRAFLSRLVSAVSEGGPFSPAFSIAFARLVVTVQGRILAQVWASGGVNCTILSLPEEARRHVPSVTDDKGVKLRHILEAGYKAHGRASGGELYVLTLAIHRGFQGFGLTGGGEA